MSEPPTIRYSKGFDCLILESSDRIRFLPVNDKSSWPALINTLRVWADNSPEVHAEKDTSIPPELVEVLKRKYLEGGGSVTRSGTRTPTLQDLDL